VSGPTRASFVLSLVALQLAVLGAAPPTLEYVCPPCGCASDGKTFTAPGACPSCGMKLVAKNDTALRARLPVAGVWVGSYGAGREIVPITVTIAAEGDRPRATFDFSGFTGGYDVAGFDAQEARFSGTVDGFSRHVTFEAERNGDEAAGTARLGTATLPLRLQRVIPLNVALARNFEGAYRTASGTLLVEHVIGDILQMTEQPNGTIRILFPVAENEYVVGPTLFAAAPVWRRIRFDEDRTGAFITVEERGGRTTARRIPLRTEPVTFDNGSVRLAGTVILPESGKARAAYVFTHGSGPNTRTSFFGLGYFLAQHGVAVLKYDKRGVGESSGDYATATFEDLADDALAGAHMLASRRDIAAANVGFWGQSQGSSIAPLAASRGLPRAPVIAASGGGLPIDQWSLLEGAAQLRSDGRFSEADVAEAMTFERLRDTYMRIRTGWDEYAVARASAVKKAWYGYPTTNLVGPSKPDSPAWNHERQFYFFDAAPALRALRGPFLGLYGEHDPASSDPRNVGAVRAALAGNPDVTLRILPRASHNLFESASPNASELPRSDRTAANLFASIADWVVKRA
jgi:uncharacterized protein